MQHEPGGVSSGTLSDVGRPRTPRDDRWLMVDALGFCSALPLKHCASPAGVSVDVHENTQSHSRREIIWEKGSKFKLEVDKRVTNVHPHREVSCSLVRLTVIPPPRCSTLI